MTATNARDVRRVRSLELEERGFGLGLPSLPGPIGSLLSGVTSTVLGQVLPSVVAIPNQVIQGATGGSSPPPPPPPPPPAPPASTGNGRGNSGSTGGNGSSKPNNGNTSNSNNNNSNNGGGSSSNGNTSPAPPASPPAGSTTSSSSSSGNKPNSNPAPPSSGSTSSSKPPTGSNPSTPQSGSTSSGGGGTTTSSTGGGNSSSPPSTSSSGNNSNTGGTSSNSSKGGSSNPSNGGSSNSDGTSSNSTQGSPSNLNGDSSSNSGNVPSQGSSAYTNPGDPNDPNNPVTGAIGGDASNGSGRGGAPMAAGSGAGGKNGQGGSGNGGSIDGSSAGDGAHSGGISGVGIAAVVIFLLLALALGGYFFLARWRRKNRAKHQRFGSTGGRPRSSIGTMMDRGMANTPAMDYGTRGRPVSTAPPPSMHQSEDHSQYDPSNMSPTSATFSSESSLFYGTEIRGEQALLRSGLATRFSISSAPPGSGPMSVRPFSPSESWAFPTPPPNAAPNRNRISKNPIIRHSLLSTMSSSESSVPCGVPSYIREDGENPFLDPGKDSSEFTHAMDARTDDSHTVEAAQNPFEDDMAYIAI